jgi:hypothetical protein
MLLYRHFAKKLEQRGHQDSTRLELAALQAKPIFLRLLQRQYFAIRPEIACRRKLQDLEHLLPLTVRQNSQRPQVDHYGVRAGKNDGFHL